MSLKTLKAIMHENLGDLTRIFIGQFDRENIKLIYTEVWIIENGNVKKKMKIIGEKEFKNKKIEMFYPNENFKHEELKGSLIIKEI